MPRTCWCDGVGCFENTMIWLSNKTCRGTACRSVQSNLSSLLWLPPPLSMCAVFRADGSLQTILTEHLALYQSHLSWMAGNVIFAHFYCVSFLSIWVEGFIVCSLSNERLSSDVAIHPSQWKSLVVAVFHSMSSSRFFLLASYHCTFGTMAYLPRHTYSDGRWFSSPAIYFAISYTVSEMINITVNLTGGLESPRRQTSAPFCEGISTLS